ncbi:MAG: site-specific integrase [Paramuribaculum sp.]|nr:site-specific integrase [Paramuribaculum sp.]
MVSIKIKFRASTAHDGKGYIYYLVNYEGIVRKVVTDYRIFPREWDSRKSSLVATDNVERNVALMAIKELIRADRERFLRITRRLNIMRLTLTVDDIVTEYLNFKKDFTLFRFMERIITELCQHRKLRTAETYQSALNSFRRFRHGGDILLDALSPELISDYETFLKVRGNTSNTTSFYMRILRAVYRRAVEADVIDDMHPFRHVYTGVQRTAKRALTLSVIRRISNLQLADAPHLDFARDMFLLSFYLRGISFVDMVYLRKTDLLGGYLQYRRRKTGQLLRIKWTEQMQTILDKYPHNPTPYLLPIIMRKDVNERSVYKNMSYNINRNLKIVADKAGVQMPLTMYCARHSWATAARVSGVPVSVISEGLGHDSESTTQIYLASVDTSVVDSANALIMSALSLA